MSTSLLSFGRLRALACLGTVIAVVGACSGAASTAAPGATSGASAAAAPAASSSAQASSAAVSASGRPLQKVTVQLSWLVSGENAGEQEAIDQGYFAQEGLDVTLQPGGPTSNGISQVASGAAEIGITSSSPALMLAVSQGIPVQAFAVGLQQHPFAFFSLPSAPVRVPQDLEGKTVGIQQSAQPLMDALIANNHLDKSKIKVVYTGGTVAALLAGQVQVIDAWTIDKAQLAPLPTDAVVMSLWDTGVKLYALTYFATAQTIQNDPGMLEAFTRALVKGWQYAIAHPQEAGTALARTASGLIAANEAQTVQAEGPYMYTAASKAGGWGTMDPSLWQQQIDTYHQLGQFKGTVPTVNQVMTTSILDATTAARMSP
jgi:NitT/TauT family transport system substrate-binding protein